MGIANIDMTQVDSTRTSESSARKMPNSQHPLLCKQVSFETPVPCPTSTGQDSNCVFCFDVPIPDLPTGGAKIKVACAGVCYKRRSGTDNSSFIHTPPPSPSVMGIRDMSLFPGFEVAGYVEELGPDVPKTSDIKVGDRVIVYPHGDSERLTEGTYAEYISVMDVGSLVKVPDEMSMQVACMLPTGALWALNAAHKIQEYVREYVAKKNSCNVLIVGTGGLSLWLLRILNHVYSKQSDEKMNLKLVIAVLKDEAVYIAQAHSDGCSIVSWSEDIHEESLIERTINACGGAVDVVIDFAPTPRILKRSMDCISESGVLVVGNEANEGLFKRFEAPIKKKQVRIETVDMGTYEQLVQLVKLVAANEIIPPTHKVFRVESAADVMDKLSKAQLEGRAILEFHDHPPSS